MIIAYSEPWYIQNSLFKHFQGYLGIFMDIDTNSATLTSTQVEGRGEVSLPFFENQKSVLILERKVQIVPIFGLDFPFKM